LRLWLSQESSGYAGQRAIVWSERSVATEEASRDEGSGRVHEPRGPKGKASIVSPITVQSG